MTVKLQFKDLSGQIIEGSFPNSTKVGDICHFLNKRLESNSIIYLISPNPKQLFYKNKDSIRVLTKSKEKYIFFFKLNNNIIPNHIEKQEKMIIPPKSAMNAYNNFMEIKNLGREHRIIYFKYASVVKSVPSDMEERVNQVVQFGYDAEDCREALRDADFDINEAVNILIRRHRNLTDEEANEPPPDMNRVLSILQFLMFSRNRRLHRSSDDDDDSDDNDDDDYDGIEEEDNDDSDEKSENIIKNEDNNTVDANQEKEPNNMSNNAEIISNQDENENVKAPVPPTSESNSPRTSINRLRVVNLQVSEPPNHSSSDENGDQHPKRRPIINNPRLRITRPNIQSNQRRITLPRRIQPKKSSK